MFVRILGFLQTKVCHIEGIDVIYLLPDMDRKTTIQRVSFRLLTQAAHAIQMKNLKWEPADLLPLSISHQKECTGVLLGQNTERLGQILPFSYSCWTGAAGCHAKLSGPHSCLPAGSPVLTGEWESCSSCSSALLPCC